MNFRDILELALQRFRTRSLRFVLTVLGVGAGIGVVFFLVSLGFGLQEVVIGRIATSESLLSLTVAVSDEAAELVKIRESQLNEFRSIEHVEDVSPLFSTAAEMELNELRAQTIAQAVDENYFGYSGLYPTYGRFFEAGVDNEIVISTTVFRLFGFEGASDALDKEIDISFLVETASEQEQEESGSVDEAIQTVRFPQKFKVVGTIESDTNSIFVPLNLFDQIPDRSYSQVKVRIAAQENIEPVREQLTRLGYSVIALTDTIEQLNSIFRITQITLAVMGIVALFIASVGMFNTLTISLLERTREVGILKAIGATNRDVWMIFLFEAFLIGFLGGLAGLVGGLLFAEIVNFLINSLASRFGGVKVDLFSTPAWFIFSILGISLTVGLLTGFYPARRAAYLNPLDALKRE